MKSMINILLRDPDRYFSTGLTQGLLMHAKATGLRLRITDNTLEKHHADVVFFAAEYAPSLCRYLGNRRTGPAHQQVFLIKEKPQPRDGAQFQGISGILYRHHRLEQAWHLVTQAWQSPEGALPQDKHLALTHQETTVLRYLSQGLSPHTIGQALRISIKTVSAHKRNAMTKLHMGRNPDLIYWLLRGGLNTLPAHRLPPYAAPQEPVISRHSGLIPTHSATHQEGRLAS
ncbi:response regulator transcription factor [Serratia quinivorans]